MNRVFDPKIFFPALLLSAVGILLIYAATYYSPTPEIKNLYQKQLIWFAAGFAICLSVFFIPLRIHEAFAYVYYFLALFLLVLLLVSGGRSGSRWFHLGPLNMQPAEPAKIAVVLAVSRFLAFKKPRLDEFKWVFVVFLMTVVPAGLVLIQPDLGSSLVFLAVFFAMILWTGMPIERMILIVTPVISIIAALHWISWAIFFTLLLILIFISRLRIGQTVFFLFANLATGMVTPLLWNNLHDYQKMRIITFLDPGQDPRGAGYQIIQSKIAVGAGGFFGQGFLQGTQTRLNFLPERHTDFIFSVLAEQFGFFGCFLLLVLFTILIYRGFAVAMKTRNQFYGYAACGFTAILVFQALINIGMAIGLTPVTGLPLPFVSYGGSSLLFFWAMIGFLLAFNRNWQEY